MIYQYQHYHHHDLLHTNNLTKYTDSRPREEGGDGTLSSVPHLERRSSFIIPSTMPIGI